MNQTSVHDWFLRWGLTAVGWACLFVALVIGYQLDGVNGYEPSIYEVFPLAGWAAFGIAFAAFTIGVIVTRRAAVRAASLTGLIMTSATFSHLPKLRGYEIFGRGDIATHLSDLHNLVSTGRLAPGDFYPAAKLYGASLIQFGGVPLELADLAVRIGIGATYGMGSVLLVRRLLRSHRWDPVVLASSFVPVAGTYAPGLVPAAFGAAYAPFALSFLVPGAAPSAVFRIARVLATLTIAFVHPLVAGVVLTTVVAVWIAFSIPGGPPGNSDSRARDSVKTSVALLAVAFIAWMGAFSVFDTELIIIRNAIAAGVGGEAAFSASLELVERAGFSLLETASLAVRSNVGAVVALAFGLSAAIIALSSGQWRGSRRLLVALLALCVVLAAATVVNGVFLLDLDVFRFVQLLAVIGPALVAVGASVFSVRRPLVAAGVVIAIATTSIPFIFASPITYRPSDHVPPGEVDAVRWLGSQPLDYPVVSLLTLRRHAERAFPDAEDPRRHAIVNAVQAPDHLVDWHETVLPNDTSKIFLVLFESDLDIYLELWNSSGRFTEADFQALTTDPRVSRVYVNQAASVFLLDINSFGPPQ